MVNNFSPSGKELGDRYDVGGGKETFVRRWLPSNPGRGRLSSTCSYGREEGRGIVTVSGEMLCSEQRGRGFPLVDREKADLGSRRTKRT